MPELQFVLFLTYYGKTNKSVKLQPPSPRLGLRTPFQGRSYTQTKRLKMIVFIINKQYIEKYNEEKNTRDNKRAFIKISNQNSRQG